VVDSGQPLRRDFADNANRTGKGMRAVRVLAAALVAIFAVLAAGCATHNPGATLPGQVGVPAPQGG